MHEARIYFFGLNIAFWYIACLDIHATKYSEGHETFVKMMKNTSTDWQLFSKTLLGK